MRSRRKIVKEEIDIDMIEYMEEEEGDNKRIYKERRYRDWETSMIIMTPIIVI